METAYYKFFQNTECESFPCHSGVKGEEFNCMFCFCPLYGLGSGCGGNFVYLDTGTKDCSACTIPHSKGGYDYVIERFDLVKELAEKNR